jgi:Xaa-Pro aminopeptidase
MCVRERGKTERLTIKKELPITRNNPKERRGAFADLLVSKDIDLAIISNPKHIFYFTGFPSNLNMYLTLMKGPRSTSFLAIKRDGQSSFLLGESELSNPWSHKNFKSKLEKSFDGEIHTYTDYDPNEKLVTYADFLSKEFSKWLKGIVSSENTRIGIEEWHLAEQFRSAISSNVTGANGGKLAGVSILSMRNVKGRDEIENLRAATKMIDFAYKYAHLSAKKGNTELDIYREMNYHTFQKYGPFGWIIGDHVSGERSLEVGGWATDRVLKKGDTVVLDLQAAYNNYWSDLCRTFVVGKSTSKEQRQVLRTLIKSLERAEEVMKPGVKGSEIYSAVNEVITKEGYPKIPHHVGHSIGLDDQEPPWFVRGSEQPLEEGMVCVVEPGIYLKSSGGIRIEDAYIITKNGNEKISHYPLEF